MAKKTEEYSGCIRDRNSIEKARDFARDSFVYGLRDKDEYTEISNRSHDIATRQLGDWFRDCLQTRTVKVRKKLKYLSLNCRDYSVNPLFRLWKTRSFTTNEIVFFFFLLDYYTKRIEPVSLAELYKRYCTIHRSDGFSRSAAQKWLQNKGCPSGIVIKDEKSRYSLAPAFDFSDLADLLYYYSETAPGGVVGSFILDKQSVSDSPFGFKQHYIGQAFDCEVICNVLLAIKNNRFLELRYITKENEEIHANVFPIKVYSSTQNGRQYLFAWNIDEKSIISLRLDRIKSMFISDEEMADAVSALERFAEMQNHIWGVSLGTGELTHVEFCIKADTSEAYIINRLYREKRCGTVTPVENKPGFFKFKADVYDAHEMFPWIRTFICRIVELKIDDIELEKLFWDGINAMFEIYSIEVNGNEG